MAGNMQNTRRSILEYLRNNGSGTVDTLARDVGLAPVTVRHHLGVLRANGLIGSAARPSGRGRPRHVFWLERPGAELVTDDRYRVLASRMLGALKNRNGHLVADVVKEVAHEVVGSSREDFDGKPLESRLELSWALLRQEGFIVRWERSGADYLVHGIGCPYRALGREHAEVCGFERELLTAATSLPVTHEQRCRDGQGNGECRFRVHGRNGRKGEA